MNLEKYWPLIFIAWCGVIILFFYLVMISQYQIIDTLDDQKKTLQNQITILRKKVSNLEQLQYQLESLKSVSYTHLDVYKRQISYYPGFTLIEFIVVISLFSFLFAFSFPSLANLRKTLVGKTIVQKISSQMRIAKIEALNNLSLIHI